MTHMTKDLDGICDMKDSLMRKVRGKMDDLDVERSTIQDVETMWRDATPEQRKRIKESLTKWSTTLTPFDAEVTESI